MTKSKEWRRKVQSVKVFYFHYYVCHLLFFLSLPYKVPAFISLISYVFAAFSLLLSGVEAVIGDESFNVGSSISAEVLKVGQKVQKWLQEPNNKTTPIRAYSGGHYSYCNVLCVYMHSPEIS